jgi:outer membrane protein
MKASRKVWALAAGLALVSTAEVSVALAAEASRTEPRIGYVDMARALNEVEDGKVAKARLKTDFEAKQKKLDKMQTDLKAKKEDFEKRQSVMKADARQSRQEELQREFMEVQKVYMQLQQELMESENHITQDIGKKLRAIIEKIGDRDDYLVILNTGETVLYNKRHMDMTDDVIREYNKQHGKK